MVAFRFDGFPTGTAVALSVTQGGNVYSGNVAAWEQPAATPMSLNLEATRLTGTAPMGVMFAATANSPASRAESPYHDIECVWEFGNPGSYSALQNTPLWGTDRNVAYGPRTAHVFDAPGSYTITCTAHDGENPPAIATITVTVEDPDTVFAGADTAVVSTAGDFSGAPAGASQHTSIAAAMAALDGRQNMRLLLRDGESYTDALDVSESGGSGRRLAIGAFPGTGPRPILSRPTGGNGIAFTTSKFNFDEISIAGCEIAGAYDPTDPNPDGTLGGTAISFGTSTNQPLTAFKTIWDMDIHNIGGSGLALRGIDDTDEPQKNCVVGNTRISGWGDYGVFAPDTAGFALVGSAGIQPTGTRNGNGKYTSPVNYPNHGCIRMSRVYGRTVLSNVDLACFSDWSAGPTSQSFQRPFRWNNGRRADMELVMDRLRIEGGLFQIYQETGSSGAQVTDNWVVADRIHYINSDHWSKPVQQEMGGVTLRNFIAVVPNCTPGAGTGVQRMFTDRAENSVAPGAQTRRSEFYSSALIDLRSDANARTRSGNNTDRDFKPGEFQDLAANSYWGAMILHAPNMVTGGETGQAPLDSAAQYQVIYDGERWRDGPVDLSRAYSNDATARFAPLSGSVAIGGAGSDEKVSLIDFDGNLRADVLAGLSRNVPSQGPYEPPLES